MRLTSLFKMYLGLWLVFCLVLSVWAVKLLCLCTSAYIMMNPSCLLSMSLCCSGLGSEVGIATTYGPGIESRWGARFLHLSRPAPRSTQPPVRWVPGLSRGVKCGQGVTLAPHPPSSAEVKNRVRATPLLSLRTFMACERVKLMCHRC